MVNSSDYNLFFKFIETYGPSSFTDINPEDPLMLELEEFMEKKDQFFFIADLLQMKIIFTSKRSLQMTGVEPSEVTPYHMTIRTHPEDANRMGMGVSKLFSLAKDLLIAENGEYVLSTDLRIQNPAGGFSNLLFQCYAFYSDFPYKTVYDLQVHTNIDWWKEVKKRSHYYVGSEMSHFRFPDKELLMQGPSFSKRELEILRMIEKGQSSEQIAENLFLSLHTVNTHRRNILKKTDKINISDLIYELKEWGML